MTQLPRGAADDHRMPKKPDVALHLTAAELAAWTAAMRRDGARDLEQWLRVLATSRLTRTT